MKSENGNVAIIAVMVMVIALCLFGAYYFSTHQSHPPTKFTKNLMEYSGTQPTGE